VDGAPTDEGHQGVTGLLQPQSAFDDGAVVGGPLDRPGVAQKVRRMQQMDVQRVALDPLAAVGQPAQQAQSPRSQHVGNRPKVAYVGSAAPSEDRETRKGVAQVCVLRGEL